MNGLPISIDLKKNNYNSIFVIVNRQTKIGYYKTDKNYYWCTKAYKHYNKYDNALSRLFGLNSN